jgi:hypothetical protein
MFQSRRSLITWKIYDRRTDGWTNDDFPTETTPGDPTTLMWKGQPLDPKDQNQDRADVDYNGKPCPPPEALAGTYKAPDGATIKVEPLTDEDRRTIVRWIDLGCPIDLDPGYDPSKNPLASYGWMLDDNRPVLTLTTPRPGPNNGPVGRLLIGAYDYRSGLDERSFKVTADFEIDGVAPGGDLSAKLTPRGDCVWELKLGKAIAALERGTVTVSVKDRQGNTTRIERTFSVVNTTAAR